MFLTSSVCHVVSKSKHQRLRDPCGTITSGNQSLTSDVPRCELSQEHVSRRLWAAGTGPRVWGSRKKLRGELRRQPPLRLRGDG